MPDIPIGGIWETVKKNRFFLLTNRKCVLYCNHDIPHGGMRNERRIAQMSNVWDCGCCEGILESVMEMDAMTVFSAELPAAPRTQTKE